MEIADLLRHWRFRVHRVQTGHYEAGRRYDRLHLSLGIPAIAVSALVGTAVFSSLAGDDRGVLITISVGMLSVTSAVLSGLQTFLQFPDLAERHKLAGARFADLKHKIELIAVFQPADHGMLKTQLSEVEQEWEKVREESPNIPAKIWDRIERTMTLEKDIEMHPSFGKVVRQAPAVDAQKPRG
jgi:hypothetical protein